MITNTTGESKKAQTIVFPLKKVNTEPVYDESKIQDKVLVVPGRSGNDHFLECEEPIIKLEQKTHAWMRNTFALNVRLTAPGFLTHPEHDTVVLPPGVYGFTQQQEYNPVLDSMQNVFD